MVYFLCKSLHKTFLGRNTVHRRIRKTVTNEQFFKITIGIKHLIMQDLQKMINLKKKIFGWQYRKKVKNGLLKKLLLI